MENNKFNYYNWANNKWGKKWQMSQDTKQRLLTLSGKIHYVPLWKPVDITIDLDTQQLIIPKNLAFLAQKYQLPQTTYYLFKYNNINNIMLECNYIISNYSKIIEAKIDQNFVSLKWSLSYGAYFFKEITNYILAQDTILETYRETKNRKQRLLFRYQNQRAFKKSKWKGE
ncbi:hypothetical protein [Spiroplasma sp. Moj]|uniref:hypothetical protein n=1 Tax=Spiroplasma sp. Moj TaxID=1922342 RepID=UPI0039EF220D|nr:hypothetical protein [Spiroplasma sp. Moj]